MMDGADVIQHGGEEPETSLPSAMSACLVREGLGRARRLSPALLGPHTLCWEAPVCTEQTWGVDREPSVSLAPSSSALWLTSMIEKKTIPQSSCAM